MSDCVPGSTAEQGLSPHPCTAPIPPPTATRRVSFSLSRQQPTAFPQSLSGKQMLKHFSVHTADFCIVALDMHRPHHPDPRTWFLAASATPAPHAGSSAAPASAPSSLHEPHGTGPTRCCNPSLLCLLRFSPKGRSSYGTHRFCHATHGMLSTRGNRVAPDASRQQGQPVLTLGHLSTLQSCQDLELSHAQPWACPPTWEVSCCTSSCLGGPQSQPAAEAGCCLLQERHSLKAASTPSAGVPGPPGAHRHLMETRSFSSEAHSCCLSGRRQDRQRWEQCSQLSLALDPSPLPIPAWH